MANEAASNVFVVTLYYTNLEQSCITLSKVQLDLLYKEYNSYLQGDNTENLITLSGTTETSIIPFIFLQRYTYTIKK